MTTSDWDLDGSGSPEPDQATPPPTEADEDLTMGEDSLHDKALESNLPEPMDTPDTRDVDLALSSETGSISGPATGKDAGPAVDRTEGIMQGVNSEQLYSSSSLLSMLRAQCQDVDGREAVIGLIGYPNVASQYLTACVIEYLRIWFSYD